MLIVHCQCRVTMNIDTLLWIRLHAPTHVKLLIFDCTVYIIDSVVLPHTHTTVNFVSLQMNVHYLEVMKVSTLESRTSFGSTSSLTLTHSILVPITSVAHAPNVRSLPNQPSSPVPMLYDHCSWVCIHCTLSVIEPLKHSFQQPLYNHSVM